MKIVLLNKMSKTEKAVDESIHSPFQGRFYVQLVVGAGYQKGQNSFSKMDDHTVVIEIPR